MFPFEFVCTIEKHTEFKTPHSIRKMFASSFDAEIRSSNSISCVRAAYVCGCAQTQSTHYPLSVRNRHTHTSTKFQIVATDNKNRKPYSAAVVVCGAAAIN